MEEKGEEEEGGEGVRSSGEGEVLKAGREEEVLVGSPGFPRGSALEAKS